MIIGRTKAAVIVGWFAKGAAIAATFANVRLLVELVGIEGFAAHAVIFSLLTWLTLLNLGLPAAVQNAVSALRARGEDSGSLRGHAVGTVFLLALLLLPVELLLSAVLRPLLFQNFEFVSLGTLWFAVFAMTTSALSQTFNQMLYAEHRPFWPNFYPAFAGVGALLGLLALHSRGSASFDLAIVVFFFPYLVGFGISLFMASPRREWRFDIRVAKELVRSSRGFAVFALLLALSSALDYVVLTRTVTPAEIGEYALVNRAFMGMLSLYGVILATRWAPVAELVHQAQSDRVRFEVARLLKYGCALAIAVIGGLWLVLDWVASLLSAGKIASISPGLAIGWSCYLLARIWSDTFATVLLGAGQTKAVNRALAIQAAVGILLQLLLAPQFGSMGVIFGMTIGLALTAGWMLPLHFLRLTIGPSAHLGSIVAAVIHALRRLADQRA
jgi:O-antigen/teichoic acid export membrane protein